MLRIAESIATINHGVNEGNIRSLRKIVLPKSYRTEPVLQRVGEDEGLACLSREGMGRLLDVSYALLHPRSVREYRGKLRELVRPTLAVISGIIKSNGYRAVDGIHDHLEGQVLIPTQAGEEVYRQGGIVPQRVKELWWTRALKDAINVGCGYR